MRKSATIIAMNNGNRGLMTFSMVVLAIPTPTKSTEPTGGVQSPIQRLSTITMPNCMGSIPSSVTIGRKMGVNMSTAGVMSIKMPTNNNNKLIINKITIGLSLKPNNTSLIPCGMFSKDITQDMLMDAPISNMTIAVVAEASNKMLGRFFHVISLSANPRTKV